LRARRWTLTVLLAAMAPTMAAGQARPDTVMWRLIDSVWVEPPAGGCCFSLRGFRLAVRDGGTRWDTLPVWTWRPPSQLGDGTLLIRVVTEEQEFILRRYDSARHELAAVRVPNDYEPKGWFVPEFFAPRKLLAYSRGARVVVRQWPGWKLIAEGPEIEGCSDTMLHGEWNADGTYIRWFPPRCTPETPAVDSLRVP